MNTIIPPNSPSPAVTGSAPAAVNSELIKESSTQSFQVDVLEASMSVPVLVDFWAPWCGPCRQLGPALEQIVTAAAGKIKLVKVNIDENQALAGQMQVQSIPAVFAFVGGQPIDGFMGALPPSEIQTFVDKILASAPAQAGNDANDMNAQIEAALEAAQSALDTDQLDRAGEIFSLVLQQMPEHALALLGMAQTMLIAGNIEDAKQFMAQVPADDQDSDGFLSLTKAVKLAEAAHGLDDVPTIQNRIEADPKDHQSRLDLAIALNAADKKAEAAEALVQSFKLDRDWNEGAAKSKLLELFEAWGPTDPATIKGRRLLSSVMFS